MFALFAATSLLGKHTYNTRTESGEKGKTQPMRTTPIAGTAVENTPQEFKLINIREVWPGEAREFTPWLAENLDTLAAHIEVDELHTDSTEVAIPGGRRLDILAKDTSGNRWAIENQYGEADHDHLTRALSYAVGLDCRAVILVAESHRPEFVAVADEWNRYSEAYGQEGIRLFLVTIEAGRIGNSQPGYHFRLVAGPNEWKSKTATKTRSLSDADRIRYSEREQFWSGLAEETREIDVLPELRASQVSWVAIRYQGPFSFQFWVTMSTSRVELRIDSSDGEKNDELYDSLYQNKAIIHKSLGTELVWDKNPDHRKNRIYWEPEGAAGYRTTPEQQRLGHKILAEAAGRFYETLKPHVDRLV